MTITEEKERLVLRSEAGSDATMKAILFLSFMMFGLLALGAISLFSGRSSGQDVLMPRSNHVGFLWAIASVAMLVVIPVYLGRLHRPALVLEFLRADKSVRRDGGIITRFERVEYLEVSESKDADGRYQYTLTLLYGDGQELVLERSYDEKAQLALADRLAAFVGTQVRCLSSSILT
jgi:hypothetical protein